MVKREKSVVLRCASAILAVVIFVGLCGCRVIYEDTEEVIEKVTYETVVVEDDVKNPASAGENGEGGENGNANGNKEEGNGGGQPSHVNDGQQKEPQLSGSLEIQIFTNESQTADKGWTSVINAFEEATGVKVTTIMGSQVNTQMSTRWMQDNPPDMIWIDGSGIPDDTFQESGKYLDITTVLQNENVYGTAKKISDVLNKELLISYNGSYYRAPVMMATHGVWYDANFMSANGFSVPHNYTELMQVSQQAADQGIAAFTYPGQYANYCLNGFILPALGAYGQDYLNQVLDADPGAYESDRMRDVLQRYSDFCRSGGFVLAGTTTMDHTTSQVRWLGHKALFIPNGLWLADEVRKSTAASFDMTYMPSPLVDASQQQTAIFYAKNIAIASKAKNMENAKAFLRFLYTEDAQTMLMKSFGYMSVRKDIDFNTASSGMLKATAGALKYVNSGSVRILYNHGSWGNFGDSFSNIINELTMGGVTAEQAQAQLVEAARKESQR